MRSYFSIKKFIHLILIFYFLYNYSSDLGALEKNKPITSENLINFSVKNNPEKIHRGEIFTLEIKAEIEKGWHIYSVKSAGEYAPPPTKLELKSDAFIFSEPVRESPAIIGKPDSTGMKLLYHRKKAFFFNDIKVPENIKTGKYNLTGKITFQLCTERICLPPTYKAIKHAVLITEGRPREKFLSTAPNFRQERGSQSRDKLPKDFISNGIINFILLAALMGLLALATPCVFPMIPLTISFFVKQSEGNSKQSIKLAFLFGLGIIGTYTSLGLILSILFGADTAIIVATNPFINIAIAIIFIIFAFSLMGFFEFRLPGNLENYFDKKARMLGGTIGVLLMGVTFTLTAFTCTVQFVGTLLIASAQGERLWPLLGMLTFSTVFALPFFLLALVPSLITSFRKSSGAWLEKTKVVFGILELMASIKFLSNADLVLSTDILTRNVVILIWSFGLLGVAGYLILNNFKSKGNLTGYLIGTVFLILSLYLVSGLDGKKLDNLTDSLLPPKIQANENKLIKNELDIQWFSSWEMSLKQAKLTGKPVFVDFTGYTCVNCRWMEENVFSIKEVNYYLKNKVIPLRLYTDGGKDGDFNRKLQLERFNTLALPFYLIISPEDKVLRSHTGILKTDEFLRFLKGE